MTEFVERVAKCPGCGCNINIQFDPAEEARRVPCLGCYGEATAYEIEPVEVQVMDKETGETSTVIVPQVVYKHDAAGNPLLTRKGLVLNIKRDGTVEVLADHGK